MTLLATCFLATVLAAPAPPAEPPAKEEAQEVFASDVTIYITAVLGDALHAIDGDTIVVRSRELITYAAPAEEKDPEKNTARAKRQEFSEALTVRLLGVDTPEVGEDGAKEAKKFTQKWLKKNGAVMLLVGQPQFGYFGRVLAIVLPEPIVDAVPFTHSLNCDLLSAGLAAPEIRYENSILALLAPCLEPLEVE
jgi:endonuclease YncB( thermonuclease family)